MVAARDRPRADHRRRHARHRRGTSAALAGPRPATVGLPAVVVRAGHPGRRVPAPQPRAGPAGAGTDAGRPAQAAPRSWSRSSTLEGWDVVHTVRATSRPPEPSRRSLPWLAAQERRSSQGLKVRAAGQPVPVGRGPAGLADRRRPSRRRGRLRRARGDGPPDPDPAGGPRLGADPGAVGHPRGARRPRHRPRARHPGHAGDVPGARHHRQGRRHPRRADRRPGLRRRRRRLVGARARGVRPALPAAAQRLDDLERGIETMQALWAPGTKAYDGARVSLPETTCYPRPVGRHPGHRRRHREPDLADRGHAR